LRAGHLGKPQDCGRATEAAKRSGERRDTLAEAVCFPGRPGKSWLDEDATRGGACAGGDGDRRADYHIGHGVDHRHTVRVDVHQIDLAAVRGHHCAPGKVEAGVLDDFGHGIGRAVDHGHRVAAHVAGIIRDIEIGRNCLAGVVMLFSQDGTEREHRRF